ncbi:MAG: disulfide reductase [Syntrophomonadaceae bacterium]|jgi:heterodisulfide reductase subunit B|nr:disulfide reductase [Syntrophomonadaceae bacterium]
MKMAYFPGCSLEASAVEYGLSTRRTAEIMGVELVEIEDWNCCGATSGHSTNKLLSLALPARNLAIAEKSGLDILAPCAACYNRLSTTEHTVRNNDQMRQKIEKVIEMECQGKTQIFSVLNLLTDQVGIGDIGKKVKSPLKGMKAACYYGCLLVRPQEHTGFDDTEDPKTMDQIVQALGAKTVEWAFKTECCGASLATSRPEIGAKITYEIIRNARESGAECLVTACPLCMMNLDMRQGTVKQRYKLDYDMPIYYVTELIAIACGDKPEDVGVHRHFVDAVGYLHSLAAKAEEEVPVKQVTSKGEPEADNDAEGKQKKIDAMIKVLQKNPDKPLGKLIEDQEQVKILVQLINEDEKKLARLAEAMVSDRDKAVKVANAYITGELKKRGKQ